MENNFQHEAVNTIYSTTDYSVFKNLGTQRNISQLNSVAIYTIRYNYNGANR